MVANEMLEVYKLTADVKRENMIAKNMINSEVVALFITLVSK